MSNVALKTTLEFAVYLRTAMLKKRGGPTTEDYQRIRPFGQKLAEKADVLMFGSKQKGEVAELFNELAEAIAIMSFLPGGITVFEMHFEAKL